MVTWQLIFSVLPLAKCPLILEDEPFQLEVYSEWCVAYIKSFNKGRISVAWKPVTLKGEVYRVGYQNWSGRIWYKERRKPTHICYQRQGVWGNSPDEGRSPSSLGLLEVTWLLQKASYTWHQPGRITRGTEVFFMTLSIHLHLDWVIFGHDYNFCWGLPIWAVKTYH